MLFRVPDRIVAPISAEVAVGLPKNTRPLHFGVMNAITAMECLSVPMSDRGVLVMAMRGRETTGIALWVNDEETLAHLQQYVREQANDQAPTVCCVSLFVGVATEPDHALTTIPSQADYYSTPFFAEVIAVLHSVRNKITFSQQREFYGYDGPKKNTHLLLTTEGALVSLEAPELTLPALGTVVGVPASLSTRQESHEGAAMHSLPPLVNSFPPRLSLQLPTMASLTEANLQALQNAPVQKMRKTIAPNAAINVTHTSMQRPLKLPPLSNTGLATNIRRTRLTSIAEHGF